MTLKEPYDIVKINPKVNNLTKDLKKLEDETLKNLKNSKAKNTLRAYASDFRHFRDFCIDNNVKYLPSDPRIISLYLTKLAQTSKFSTLKRRIASISVVHKMKGHYLDTKHPLIIENLLGIKRVNGSNQKAKKPILINDLKLIINVIDETKQTNKRKIRDKAIILVGFSGGFRRSELVNIEYEDIEFVNEGVKIIIKRSKTDQSGEGMTKAIPYFDNKAFCQLLV